MFVQLQILAIFFLKFYVLLLTLKKIKSKINQLQKIPEGKVIKGHWSQNYQNVDQWGKQKNKKSLFWRLRKGLRMVVQY